MRVGPYRSLNAKELLLSNCGAGKDSEGPLESKINSLMEPGKLQSIRIAESDMTEAT